VVDGNDQNKMSSFVYGVGNCQCFAFDRDSTGLVKQLPTIQPSIPYDNKAEKHTHHHGTYDVTKSYLFPFNKS